ncbi:hypothetical protein F5Y15DRAFT_171020 [Xylariaceae sp. FL0016]|nr:hypothetical protein F5Y15DRAFT_171020 [Xylariaceae sp. FL0016]
MPNISPAISPNGQPHGTSKQRHKRTRTGCERCRMLHRKCDEGKPQCRRCTHAEATCRYPTHISFLDKNAITLSDSVPNHLEDPLSQSRYSSLEFVINEDPPKLGEPKRSRSIDQPEHALDSQLRDCLLEPSLGPATDSHWPLIGQSSLSDDEAGLLKYFCHSVTPWLDVYDQTQTFRHLLTRLAMKSPCVLEGLLQLSAVSSGQSVDVVERRGIGLLHLQAMATPPGAESLFSVLRIMAGFVLVRTRLFVRDVPDQWEHSFHGGATAPAFIQYKFTDAVDQRIWSSLLFLMARLEIAYSLMKNVAPTGVSELLDQIMGPILAYQSQRVLLFSLRCLALLARVLDLRLMPSRSADGDGPSQAANTPMPRTSRTYRWDKLLGELLDWYKNRPPELHPLVEDESDTVPTIIFANGAGVSSNLLYHTAMFWLLDNTPKSTLASEREIDMETQGPQMRTIWHTRRVCGIAFHSEPEHARCWDPCSIAALWSVARRMTHSSEQNTMILCLSRVEAAGWKIGGLREELSLKWGL